jgi:heme-degrading monooxygenase HmoA
MITRIVKMCFSDEFVGQFKILFDATKANILVFDGCISVKLLQDEANPSLFFTISEWESVEKLNNYRNSELFIQTWKKVKPNFLSKAEAWSLSLHKCPDVLFEK